MAQGEFIGVIREIFSKWRVEVVQHGMETPEAARERLARSAQADHAGQQAAGYCVEMGKEIKAVCEEGATMGAASRNE